MHTIYDIITATKILNLFSTSKISLGFSCGLFLSPPPAPPPPGENITWACIISSRFTHILVDAKISLFLRWIIFCVMYIPHFLCPSICWWTFGLFLYYLSYPPYCFHSGCTILHSCQQCIRVLISSPPHQQLLSSVFSVIAIYPNWCEMISHYDFNLHFPDD